MLAAALMLTLVCHAQESKSALKVVKTEPNGVVIYEAQGVERPLDAPAPQVVREAAPTFLELSQSELETRLYDVDRKLTLAKERQDAESISVYENEKQRVLERIEVVKGGK
ncbi:hypothetical protein HYN59_09720 [Flavobacterium album]|uniref:Uncharacterized protein n=2 Tax=Flavobacterium album TaxID=2175091 RepID=A0A2S1QY91_9FLAO|nr:hypothetical protein HYN59_09720 [Flavobacterium album]